MSGGGRQNFRGARMKHIITSLAPLLFSVALAAPAFAQGGGDGPGDPGSRGPRRGPEAPPGGGGGGGGDKKEEPAKGPKPQIESMEIHLRFLPTDLKSCDAIEKTLQKIALVKKIVVTP